MITDFNVAIADRAITRRAIVGFIFLLFASISYSQVINIDDSFEFLKVRNESYSYQDSDEQQNIEQIRIIPLGKWKKVPRHGFTSTQGDFAYWIQFKLRSTIETNVYLTVDFTFMDELVLFVENNHEITTIENLGDRYDVSDRTIKYRLPTFKIPLYKNSNYRFLLYAQKDKSVGVMPISLYGEEYFINHALKEENKVGIAYGLMIALMIIAFLTAIYFRDISYLYYGVFVSSLLIFLLASLGTGQTYIWGQYPSINTFIGYFSTLLSQLAFGMTIKSSFRLSSESPKLNISLNILLLYYIIVPIILTALYILGVERGMVSMIKFAHFSIILFPFYISFICGYLYWKTKEIKALFVLLIFQISLSAMILMPLVPTGLVPRSAYQIYKWLFPLECFLLLIVLIHDLYKSKKDKLLLQEELINEKNRNTKSYLNGQSQERKRLARQLHDGLSLRLAALKMRLSNISEDYGLSSAVKEIDIVSDEVRSISHALSPYTLSKKGLLPAIEEEIFRIEALNNDLVIHYATHGEIRKLPSSYSEVIYFSFMELLNNNLKHSESNELSVHISFEDNTFDLIMHDDGHQYENTSDQRSNGIGLQNIYSRIELVGGTFKVYKNQASGMVHEINIQTKPF